MSILTWWFVLGFLGCVVLAFLCLNNGHDITTSDMAVLLILFLLGPVCATIALSALISKSDGVIIKGRKIK